MADTLDILVPDIGDFDGVDVTEVLVAVGDVVAVDQSLIVLESDKASMEVPSPAAGTITEILVAKGATVKEGHLVARLAVVASAVVAATNASVVAAATEAAPAQAASAAAPAVAPPAAVAAPSAPTVPAAVESPAATAVASPPRDEAAQLLVHASPSVRRFARVLGADLTVVPGTGPKGRVLREDVEGFVKAALTRPVPSAGTSTGSGLPVQPDINYGQFGPVETEPLTKINKLTGHNLTRSWLLAPRVTQFDEADVTELEDFRKSLAGEAEKAGLKLTFLAFLMKAVAHTLGEFPRLNASLAADGESLVLKRYYHLGIAVDTPKGLVVPVVRDVDKKGVYDLARELAEVSGRAREGKLTPKDFAGASFTITSLGGIGGTQFTPIVNVPEVGILGVSRSAMKPVWDGNQFIPRLILPLALSYDHRVVDGAYGVRFTTRLATVLSDLRRILL